jgi:hypothetical protein
MSDREKILADFVQAALELMKAGLSQLPVEKAFHVSQAQKMGADICLVFAPGAGTIVGALHPPDPDAEVLELFQIVVAVPEGSTN